MSDAKNIKIGEFTIYTNPELRKDRLVGILKEDGEGGCFNEIDFEKVVRDFYNENF